MEGGSREVEGWWEEVSEEKMSIPVPAAAAAAVLVAVPAAVGVPVGVVTGECKVLCQQLSPLPHLIHPLILLPLRPKIATSTPLRPWMALRGNFRGLEMGVGQAGWGVMGMEVGRE